MPLQEIIKQNLNDYIIGQAKNLGFYDCGVSRAEELSSDKEFMEWWIEHGYHGDMAYLEKNKEKRYNPQKLVENARSVITVLYNYYPNKTLNQYDNYKFSKYAYGTDYHYVIKDKLRKLCSIIEEKTGNHNSRVFVDSAPVLDRAWARKSGLGFIGKNTMLINKKGGSFFFIGHIITELELHYERSVDPKNYCGKCTKCIDSCPTNAIGDNYVDSNRCLSYLTIEYRGELDKSQKENFQEWIYGCDVCQDVCPWNRFSKPHQEPLFEPSDLLLNMVKSDWDNMDKPTYRKLFTGSAVNRTRYKGLKRNIEFLRE